MTVLCYSLAAFVVCMIFVMFYRMNRDIKQCRVRGPDNESLLKQAVELLQEDCECGIFTTKVIRASPDMRCDPCQRKADFIVKYYREVYP